MAPPTLPIALAGLGRMGKRHAAHFLHKVARARLVAVSTPSTVERSWAVQHLVPYGVRVYGDYDAMLEGEEGKVEGVVIASVTTVHAEQAIKAIERGLHVLCEKPLSTDGEISQTVVRAAASHPDLKIMCGFSRRFDPSYRSALSKITSGQIGHPTIVRSQTCDKRDRTGFFVDFARESGGIFVDCSIHDIDLALWLLGAGAGAGAGGGGAAAASSSSSSSSSSSPSSSQQTTIPTPKSATSVGVCAIEPRLARHGDVDNAIGVVEFHTGQLAHLYASRMMAAGQEDSTEIIGTEGKITVNLAPRADHVEVHGPHGISREVPPTFFERFEGAFVREAEEWVGCCIDGREVPVPLEGAVRAVEIGCALQESLRTGRKVWWDEGGRRVERAGL